MLFDTHCHLDFDLFDADRDEVIARVAGAGVIGLVTVGIDVPSLISYHVSMYDSSGNSLIAARISAAQARA